MNDPTAFLLKEITETKKNFSNLSEKLLENARGYSKKYTSEDIRCGFFTVSFDNVLWLLINLDAFLELIKNKPILDKYVVSSDTVYKQYLISHNNITRMSLLTKIMFNVEDFLKRILTHFKQPADIGYYNLSEKYLKFFNFYTPQRHGVLILPAQIRNSLHGGGFTEYPIDITIENIQFKAEIGQRITFANWKNLYISINAVIDLLIDSLDFLKDESFISSNYVKMWKSNPLSDS